MHPIHANNNSLFYFGVFSLSRYGYDGSLAIFGQILEGL